MLLESALIDLSEADSCLVMERNNSSAQGSYNENPVEEKPAVESENHDAMPITPGSNRSSPDRSLQIHDHNEDYDAVPITPGSNVSSTDRSLQIHHDNEDLTPRRLSEREKKISVDPQSVQNFCTSPGSVPFEWEMKPGVPKVKVRVPVFTGPLQLPPARIVVSKNRAPSMTSSAGSSATPSPRSISSLMRSMLKPKGSVLHTSHSNRKDNNYCDDYDATASSDECTNSSSPVSILYPHFERAQLDSSLRVLARQRSMALARAVDSQYVAELRRARSCNVQTNAVSAGAPNDRVLTKSKSRRRNGNSSRNGETDDDLFHDDDSDHIVARVESLSRTGQEFTCGGICSFLPFVRQKPKQKHDDDVEYTIDVPSSAVIMRRQSSVHSLEKFDCGDSTPSSASSMIYADEEGGSRSNQLYFERPNEIFVESSNEAFSPVAAAFVFDGDRRCPRSVLKKNNMNNKFRQPSRTPSRRVRFSVDTDGHLSSSESSSSCNVTPRLRRAREDFNIYLAAETHNLPCHTLS